MRTKAFQIRSEDVLDVLRGGKRCVLPEGAKYRRCGYDVVSDSLTVVVEHESFDVVPEGAICPLETMQFEVGGASPEWSSVPLFRIELDHWTPEEGDIVEWPSGSRSQVDGGLIGDLGVKIGDFRFPMDTIRHMMKSKNGECKIWRRIK
jgi:hypothetical protein